MHKVLIIDDDPLFLKLITQQIGEGWPNLSVFTCNNSIQSLRQITPDLDLLLVDLEMPKLDGTKLIAYAIARGLHRSQIIVLSAREADYLHKQIPLGQCLAVLNKHEAKQKAVLAMIFDALEKKSEKKT
ncbi:MAG: response regulator [Deltaproteobacteria bacterium]|nr:response regulator [Deltaproteobacteria bacterium]